MRYVRPKNPVRVSWHLSDQTVAIVEQYAKYTNYEPQEVVDQFLKNMLGDPGFQRYLKNTRRKVRIAQRIFDGDENMALLYEYTDDYKKQLDELAQAEMQLHEFGERQVSSREMPHSPDRI